MSKRRSTKGWRVFNFKQPRRMHTYWKRHDRVRDPKTAFFYLLDNVCGENSGKLIQSRSSRGEYFWVERSRGCDQSYFIVRKRGNYVTAIRRRWLVDGEGVNTFIGSIVGFEKEPVMHDEIILRHPIMDVQGFAKAYAEATPELGHWEI